MEVKSAETVPVEIELGAPEAVVDEQDIVETSISAKITRYGDYGGLQA